jgi:acetoin utilization deacetylase AcuC-like enzyme
MVKLRRFLPSLKRKKSPVRFIYSDSYWIVDLSRHIFPAEKYRLLFESLVREGVKKDSFVPPSPASDEDLLRVHSPRYIKKLKSGKLSHSEILSLELPYSVEMFDFFRLMVGGSISTAETSLNEGLTVHIGGGFHHAFADHGEGFCLLNDVAVAIEKMKQTGKINKAMVVDCDVHQGNGTASLFSNRDYVFTFSIHQMDIYPSQKPRSSKDVGLWSGNGDEEYLSALRDNFPALYKDFVPDLVVYLAGADPYKRDQLGGLELTFEGLKERDRIVLEEARILGIPVAVLLAGGYAADVSETVRIHLNTIKTARAIQKKHA